MANGPTLRILACQIDIPEMRHGAERDAHLAATAAMVSDALARQGADLVVLPELSSIDYSRAAFDHLDELAELADGASFQCWRAVARRFGCHIVYGFARQAAEGVYISIGVVDPNGELVGTYDKLHIAQYGASMEKEYFKRGDHLLIFTVNGVRIAPIVCYDIRIPELSRTLAVDHKVDLILHCGAYYRDESFFTWHDFATVRAMENQIFFLSLNRAGANWGASLFCRPWMDEETRPVGFAEHDEMMRWIEMDLAEIAWARDRYTFLADRFDAAATAVTDRPPS